MLTGTVPAKFLFIHAKLFGHDAPDSFSLIPLAEILSEILGAGPATKKVTQQYERIINHFGTELSLLMEADSDEIEACLPMLGEAVARMRNGNVTRRPGSDGEYGVITLFSPQELETSNLRKRLKNYEKGEFH